jgi:breast cancer 2 susceptibility protein
VASLPQLEVTDGWYRLRAEVDEPLARAIRRNVIRVGRKIGVIDAKVCLFYSHISLLMKF